MFWSLSPNYLKHLSSPIKTPKLTNICTNIGMGVHAAIQYKPKHFLEFICMQSRGVYNNNVIQACTYSTKLKEVASTQVKQLFSNSVSITQVKT